ncbi:MAG: hypothetical protein P8X74_12880 [Reinekea sp.]
MLPKNFNEPMGAPAIFEKQIEIKLLHPASRIFPDDSCRERHGFWASNCCETAPASCRSNHGYH